MIERRTAAGCSVLAMLVLAVHAPALTTALFWDDHVYRFFVLESGFTEVVGRGLFGLYFRPFASAVWWVAARLFGGEPLGYHVLSLGLHLMNVGLAAALARRIMPTPGSRGPAIAVLAVFALGPVAAVAVAWASNLATLVAVAFGLGALYVAAGNRRRPTAAALLVFLALVCKEDSLAFLPAVSMLLWTADRRRLKSLAPLAGAVVVFVLWRLAALGTGGNLVDGRILNDPTLLGVGLTVVVVALWLLWWVREPVKRLVLIMAMPPVLLGGALFFTLPAIGHGLRLRLLYLASAAATVALMVLVSGLEKRAAAASTLALAIAAGAAGGASWLHHRHWRQITADSHHLVTETVRALDGLVEGLDDVSGPIWVAGQAEEIALDPAVKLLRPEWKRSMVLLRPLGLNFLAVDPDLYPALAEEITLWAIPGNPAVSERWVGVAGFARVHRYRAAARGTSEMPVISVGAR